MELRKCKQCNKEFVPAGQHSYKIGGSYFCSYTCYRKGGGDGGKPTKYSRVTTSNRKKK